MGTPLRIILPVLHEEWAPLCASFPPSFLGEWPPLCASFPLSNLGEQGPLCAELSLLRWCTQGVYGGYASHGVYTTGCIWWVCLPWCIPQGVHRVGIPGYIPQDVHRVGITRVYMPPMYHPGYTSLPMYYPTLPPWVYHCTPPTVHYWVHCITVADVRDSRALGSRRRKPLGESLSEVNSPPRCVES